MSRDSLNEVAIAAASAAAGALASILECGVSTEPPRLEQLELEALEAKIFPESGDMMAVFSDLVGLTRGLAGIVLTSDCLRQMLQRVVPDSNAFGPLEQSALRELGNIALSAAAGAVADLCGGPVIPSVPRLGDEISEVLLVDELLPGMHRLPVFLVETDLLTAAGPLPLVFVFVPEH